MEEGRVETNIADFGVSPDSGFLNADRMHTATV